MEALTLRDNQRLLQAIQELYSLNDLSSFDVKSLAIVDQLVPSEVPGFHTTHVQSRHIVQTSLPGYPVFTPEMQEVSRQNLEEHPLVKHTPRTLGGAYKISDFMTPAEFHRLEGLYQQFLRLMNCEDQMCMFFSTGKPQSWHELVQGNATLVGIALHRSQRNFTERDRLILNLLRPHLFQAYCNVQHYHQMQRNLTQLHQSIDRAGLISVSNSGQIQLITSQAVEYLQTYFAEPVHSYQLPDHLWAWVRYQIALTKQSNSSQSGLPLRVEQAGKQLVIRLLIEPHDDRYLLLLEEQTLSLKDSLKLLNLTTRETDVLYRVIHGEDNQAIANHLDIHVSTVRKHLESIFRKLEVQSRTEAIAQVLDKLGIFTLRSLI